MSPVDFVRGGGSNIWSWFGDRVWQVERAFEQARVAKAVANSTRTKKMR